MVIKCLVKISSLKPIKKGHKNTIIVSKNWVIYSHGNEYGAHGKQALWQWVILREQNIS